MCIIPWIKQNKRWNSFFTAKLILASKYSSCIWGIKLITMSCKAVMSLSTVRVTLVVISEEGTAFSGLLRNLMWISFAKSMQPFSWWIALLRLSLSSSKCLCICLNKRTIRVHMRGNFSAPLAIFSSQLKVQRVVHDWKLLAEGRVIIDHHLELL